MTLNGKWLMNDLRRIWKVVIMAYLKCNPQICLERLRRTIKNLSQNGQHPCRDLNWELPKYKSTELLLYKSAQCELVVYNNLPLSYFQASQRSKYNTIFKEPRSKCISTLSVLSALSGFVWVSKTCSYRHQEVLASDRPWRDEQYLDS